MAECPNENTLTEFIEGCLPTTALAGINEHLDACNDCRVLAAQIASWRSDPNHKSPPSLPPESSAQGLALKAGQHLGSYVVVRQLGQGGMGVVFEAIHEQIGRKVAIKILHPALAADPDLAGRFLTEARAANRIQHPGLVSIFELGSLAGGVPYIIMEFLAGESLAERFKRLGPDHGLALIPFLQQAAQALAAAHGGGVVHRDRY